MASPRRMRRTRYHQMTALYLDSDGLVIIDQPRRTGPEGRVQLRPIKTIRQQGARKHEERVHKRCLVFRRGRRGELGNELVGQIDRSQAGTWPLVASAGGSREQTKDKEDH